MATLFMALSAQFLCIMDVLSKDFNLLVEALGKQVVTMTLSLSIHNTIWREKDCCPEALVGNFFPVFFPPTLQYHQADFDTICRRRACWLQQDVNQKL